MNTESPYTRLKTGAPERIPSGGPVYPILAACEISPRGGIENRYATVGLTLRNHAALTVLAAIVAHKGPTIDPAMREYACCTALDYADAFIAAAAGTER